MSGSSAQTGMHALALRPKKRPPAAALRLFSLPKAKICCLPLARVVARAPAPPGPGSRCFCRSAPIFPGGPVLQVRIPCFLTLSTRAGALQEGALHTLTPTPTPAGMKLPPGFVRMLAPSSARDSQLLVPHCSKRVPSGDGGEAASLLVDVCGRA